MRTSREQGIQVSDFAWSEPALGRPLHAEAHLFASLKRARDPDVQ
jgi:hypothetical protein